MSASLVTARPDGAITTDAPARITAYLIRSAAVASLCGLLFGFETAVISGATEWLRIHFGLSDSMLGFVVASGLFGAIAGSALVARPMDRFGRRGGLFGVAILFFVASLGCAMAWSLAAFLTFRVLGGLAIGGASVAGPLYIAELSPAAYRGRLVTITQLNIVLGILLAYLSNYVISTLNIGVDEARWMFGVMALPSAAFFILIFFVPQSPRWLVAQGRIDEARQVFKCCGTETGRLEEEITAIRRSFDLERHSMQDRFFRRQYVTPIVMAVAIAAFNQLSGINAVLYYTGYIFTRAGAARTSALMQSVVVGLVLLAFTAAAFAAIDRLGRRTLMIVGSVGYIVSLSSVALIFHMGFGGWPLLLSLLLFVASHAFGQGAVIWVFIGEIFPNRLRARGQALGSLTHWMTSAVVSWTFPIIAAKSASSAFGLYALCMLGQLIGVLLVMPETRGVSLEEIQRRLRIS